MSADAPTILSFSEACDLLRVSEKTLRAAFVAMNETPSGTWKRMKAEGVTPRRMFNVKMAPRYRAMILASNPTEKTDAG